MQLIKKANDLVQARYSLSLNEQRLILYLVGKVKKEDKNFKEYEFTFSELADLTEIHKSRIYAELAVMAENLLKKPICFLSKNGLQKDFCNWCSWFSVNQEDKSCKISFDPRLKPYLLKLQKYFTSYNIKYVSGFSSKHSFRIYELCKQYERLKIRKMSIVELKSLLELEHKYSRVTHFKEKVINPALADINKNSDLYVSVKYHKIRRTITSLTFDIQNGLEHCKNEAQEPYLMAEKKNQAVIQAKKEKTKKAEVYWMNKWTKLSDSDRQNWGGDGKGYVYFRAKKGILPS